jgi:hypothetical protein
MVSIVPVLFLYLAIARRLTVREVAAFLLCAVLPFLPFLIANAGSVWYAMVGVYLSVMKTFVWQSTTWAIDTYGITGRLLERGLGRYVELTQAVSMLIVYALACRSMRSGQRPEPWMGVALLVFSMTTLWSVTYLYFDVWILLVCALVAQDFFPATPTLRTLSLTAAVCVLSMAVVLGAAAWRPGSRFAIDVGDPAFSGYTGGGFGRDEAVVDDGRTVVWVEGETARIRLPRAGWRGTSIRVDIRPYVPHGGLTQRVSASLNGRAIGVATLEDRWQQVTFETQAGDWNYGFNVLDLTFSYAAPSSSSSDKRMLSAAIDRVVVGGGR